MAKTNFQSIDEYHQGFDGETLKRMETIREIIHKQVPDAVECISYQIPCFKYKGYLIYYCAFPKHISISYPYTSAFWEYFKKDLEGFKTSKSVIQFPLDKPLPIKLIETMIVFRKNENDENPRK